MNRTRRILGNVLIALSGLLLVASATAKFAHVPKLVSELGSMGFDGNKILFVAILEISSAVLFLVPVTRPTGLLLVCSFLGGAIATHLQHGRSIVQPAVILGIVWFGTLLRHRRSFWTLSFEEPVDRSLASNES